MQNYLPDVDYKIQVKPISERKRIIQNKVKAHDQDTRAHEQRYYVQHDLIMCPVINLPIELPTYHLNNGRTRSAQSHYIFNEGKTSKFFANHQEDNLQQKIQHKLLFKAAQDSTANIYKELKKSKVFKKDEAILLDKSGMVINGNRRLSSVRELYAGDPNTYKNFEYIPCAIIQKDLSATDIKDIEGYYQIKKQFRQDYDWISLALDIKYEKDDLGSSFEEIGSIKDFKAEDVEMYYELIKQVDICLADDWKQPKGYPLVEDQKQIWMDTAKRAAKTKDPAAKLAIWKTCRLISINSKNLGDRAYNFAKDFQNRNNLKEIIDQWAIRYHIKEDKSKKKKSDDPLDEVSEPSQYNLSIIDKLPIKKNAHEMIQEFRDNLVFKKDDQAAKKMAAEILMKSTNLNSKEMPEMHRNEILRSLKKAKGNIEKIIIKLGK